MKKEYHFTITRTDRIYLVVLVMALLSWELIKYVLPRPENWNLKNEMTAITEEIKPDSLVSVSKKIKTDYSDDDTREPLEFEEPHIDLQPLMIQEAGESDLIQMGFRPRVAQNIIKYQIAGGRIDHPDDLLKIYGMDSVQWVKALPYLLFPEPRGAIEKDDAHGSEIPITVDLNTADSTTLDALPGIGPVLSSRIIKYRNRLGGFCRPEQLLECYGVKEETFDLIRPYLVLTTPHHRLNINEVDLQELFHPYLPSKMARILHAYRSQHGSFHSSADLRKVYPPDTTWCDKLLPYLRFE